MSPSGDWIVTARWSGQGEWGYDVLRSHPLERQAGITAQIGYILDLPVFSEDECCILGGYGEDWLGGWWRHPDDEHEHPARGGLVTFGWLFRHHLPSHEVEYHELQMIMPGGWLPTEPDGEEWIGPRKIAPYGAGGVQMTLPGAIPFQLDGPLPKTIVLPTPHPDGGRLLT